MKVSHLVVAKPVAKRLAGLADAFRHLLATEHTLDVERHQYS